MRPHLEPGFLELDVKRQIVSRVQVSPLIPKPEPSVIPKRPSFEKCLKKNWVSVKIDPWVLKRLTNGFRCTINGCRMLHILKVSDKI